ncbi:hypothetical protein ISN44_As05g029120 [Arabidopsis suecica]|uniref:Uncharacterized protein n=1 Tax=Arabidopsis suecica TaxID=45249 RepID=A0A8T2DHC0_ARASU|nr:hypothetical protein ISN44_As05g029120 [Arabidopsis suecica]
MTVRETSRLWLFIGRFLMDPVVWRDGNIILGILNRTIHRPRSQHPMAIHYKLHRYTLVNTPERALYILSYERPAGVVETEAVFGAGRGGARAGRRRRREGAGRGRGRGQPSHECLVDEVEGEGFGADAGRGRVEDDDAVGFELLDLNISLKGWLSVAISSGMETLQYEELKTQYEKTLRSCMIPSNSYLQYTLIRDGGNQEHLLTLSKKSQTLLCKKITPANSGGGGLDENDDLSQLQPMTVSKDISLKGWLSVAISSGMETMQYEELKTQYEKTLRSCKIPSNSYLQYTLIRDGGNLEHLLTLSKNSQTLLCKVCGSPSLVASRNTSLSSIALGQADSS